MLKAKSKCSSNRRKDEAIREVLKIDNDKVVFARITSKEMKKLKTYLLAEDITIVEWVREKIGEI